MAYITISTIMAFIAVTGFCILFDVPKNELLLCAVTGSTGWLIYSVVKLYSSAAAVAFLASVVITLISCVLARIRKRPFTVFLIGGIIPLVPGGTVYYMMLDIINSRTEQAANNFVLCVKLASAISVGIIFVLMFAKNIYGSGKKHK